MPKPAWIRRRAMAAAAVFCEIVIEKLDRDTHYLHFPRDIAMLVSFTLEIPIIAKSPLTLHSATEYLCILRDMPESQVSKEQDRQLCGLLHVGPPANMILVEQQLSPHMRNYVIAHELGHYLHDIFMVQQLWQRNLHEQKEAVLQAFSWQEMDPWLELSALLKGLPERPRTITERGQAMRQETKVRELLADAIALELLVPWQTISSLFHQHSRTKILTLLSDHFGIPPRVADACYDDLRYTFAPPPDLLDSLFASVIRKQKLTDTPEK